MWRQYFGLEVFKPFIEQPTAKWIQERYIQCGPSMMSWVDPYPFIESIHTLKSKGMDQLNKRVWINFKKSLTVHTVFFSTFSKAVQHFLWLFTQTMSLSQKNAVQHGVKMKMSPTQNPTILKCIAMNRTKRREGAQNRSSLDVS